MKIQSTKNSPTKYIQFLSPAGFSVPGDTFEILEEDEDNYYYNDGLDRYCYIEKSLAGDTFRVFEPEPVKKPKHKKPPTTWKSVEGKIAAYWGGKRRGADFKKRNGPGGKNDVIDVPGWSIEIKHSKRPTFGLMTEAVDQAIAAKENPDDIPVAVVHKLGDSYEDSLVVMRLSEFEKFFINQATDKEIPQRP